MKWKCCQLRVVRRKVRDTRDKRPQSQDQHEMEKIMKKKKKIETNWSMELWMNMKRAKN